MTGHDPATGALADLVAELTGVARPPQFVDPQALDRLNTAFGRVRDLAPDAYRSDRSIEQFHFETDFFGTDPDTAGVQLDVFGGSRDG